MRLCWRPANHGEIDLQVSNRVSLISAAGGLVPLLKIIPLYRLNGGNLTWPQQLIDGVTIEDACAALHGRISWIFAVSKPNVRISYVAVSLISAILVHQCSSISCSKHVSSAVAEHTGRRADRSQWMLGIRPAQRDVLRPQTSYRGVCLLRVCGYIKSSPFAFTIT
jgi:hypothetical protein